MNRKIVGVIIIITGLIFVIGIIYVIFFHKFSQQEVVQTEQSPTSTQQIVTDEQPITAPVSVTTTPVTPLSKKTKVSQEDLERIATSFIERLGSYSNQSDYGNVRDLKIFMSADMQIWADNYIKQVQADHKQTAIYYGITTKAITTEVQRFDDKAGEAEILVKSQRREATGTTANATAFYQDAIIKFVHEKKGTWKVDSVSWQKK
ncbi:MAG: hypothetical protein ABH818_03135 [Patescibacteria group bacterium]|nr:hypothetical protein [Patescibacteria group bacterium]